MKLGIPSLLAITMLLVGCVASHEVPSVTRAPVGQWPNDVVFDPGSRQLFVADEGSATITVLRSDGETVGTIQLTTRARHLAVDPELGRLYAPNEGSAFVAAFDTRDLKERFRVPVGRQPHGIAVDRSRHRVFVGIEGEGALTAFDGRTGQILFTVPVGPGPGGVAADPETGRVFVVSVKADRVIVIDGMDGRRLARVPVGYGPTHVGINEETGIVYVLNTEADS
ncbi:MAG: YncE family protein, partial [Rhodothermales bacterium]